MGGWGGGGAVTLNGRYGNFPGRPNEVKSPPHQLKLVDNLNGRDFAIHATAFNPIRCIGQSSAEEFRFTGAYFYLEDSARTDPYYRSIQQYVEDLAGKSPTNICKSFCCSHTGHSRQLPMFQ